MRTRLISVVAVIALTLTACGSDGADTPQGDDGEGRTTTTSAAPDNGQSGDNGEDPTTTTTEAPDNGQSGDDDGGSQGLPPGGDGTYVVDGESFDATVYRCEPFTSPGNEPDDREISTLAFRGGSEGLEVEIGYATGIDQGKQYDRQVLFVFHSRPGDDGGLQQFEGAASQDSAGAWYAGNELFFDGLTPLDSDPVTLDGNRLSGGPLTLMETWPNEGGSSVVVDSWELTIPDETWSQC